MLEIGFFYTAATVALVATVMAMTRANAIHALIYLIVSLLAVAVIFFLIGAPFAAALEIVIYAGAIMVLFVFVFSIAAVASSFACFLSFRYFLNSHFKNKLFICFDIL